MAMKKREVPPKKSKKADDTVIYKALIVLVVACAALLALRLVSRYYPITGHMLAVHAGLGWAVGVFGVAAAAGLVGLFLGRKGSLWRRAGWPLFLVGLVLALSCLVLYWTWIEYIPALYFVFISIAVLYLIELLYQPEFFLLSVVNVCAGGVFYRLSRLYSGGVVFTRPVLLWNVLLALVILLAALLVFLAGKRKGVLRLAGRSCRVLSRGATPLPLYILCAIWLICLIASAFVGAALPYYCVFAAVAFELVAAVYYTMKLS